MPSSLKGESESSGKSCPKLPWRRSGALSTGTDRKELVSWMSEECGLPVSVGQLLLLYLSELHAHVGEQLALLCVPSRASDKNTDHRRP